VLGAKINVKFVVLAIDALHLSLRKLALQVKYLIWDKYIALSVQWVHHVHIKATN